ncbi:hypothetical protein GCM10022289_19170 [Pedobacter jeongneungensis]|uniref:HTH luxR-type domain-containing protein n=1 Tax=Pedobacter jeongneungensis TaxID=947309 RepID=A0ABP8BC05_9SPHI
MQINVEVSRPLKSLQSNVPPRQIFFTPRELEILQLMADGLDSQKIADRLFLSINTVRTHRKNMQERHKCLNAAGLVSLAFRKGIIQ